MPHPTLPYDVEAVRNDFPILHQEHHPGTPLIYLDNAASSQKPRQVIEAMNEYYRTTHSNVHRGIHKLSESATLAYEGARKKIRSFINASNWREVIFTRGTTESINLVAQTWGRANLGPGDVVVSSVMEHHANIVPWQILAAERGFSIEYIPVTSDGQLDLEVYERLLTQRSVKLVSVVHCSNVLGTVNPIADMARQAHQHGALFLADGAQSVPHMPVDVQALDVDFFVFSGHKMAGPTGIGILYAKRAILESMPPYQGGGDMIAQVTLQGSTWNELPYKFEAGTPSIAEAIGLGAAVDYLGQLGMTTIHRHEQSIIQYALERLSEIPGITVYGPDACRKGAVAAFTLERIHAHDVAQLLDADGIAVRAGHHCAMPLHQHLGVTASARASFYLYSTPSEVDKLAEALYKTRRAFAL
ncbi:MAG: cysteine desulfurase [Anaerolineae bacterium]|nr:cysteine desulfurase [Anaerolineae bacterium]MDW8173327.1 cysteine desulfurase [Anaerolineae bacterium]